MALDVDMQATEKAKALLGKSRHQPKHVPSMDWREVPTFYQSLVDGTIPHVALRLLILTATRSSEVRFCYVDEIEGNIWTIQMARTRTLLREIPRRAEPLLFRLELECFRVSVVGIISGVGAAITFGEGENGPRRRIFRNQR
jgi:integrase